MSVTLEFMDLLVFLLVALNVTAVVVLIRFSMRAGASVERIERTVRDLEPEVTETLQAARHELEALQGVTRHVEGMADNAGRVVQSATDRALPLIDDVEKVRDTIRRLSALVHGLQVAVRAYQDMRHENRTNEGDTS